MLPRSLSEEEFKKQTVQEYLQGEYGLDREQAEELANQEWNIRQNVENHTKVKKVQLKKKMIMPVLVNVELSCIRTAL